MHEAASSARPRTLRPRPEGPRFPCGTSSPSGAWRLSRTLLSVRGPDLEPRRLAGLHVPLAGAVSDDGTTVILDRQDAGNGRYALCCYRPDGTRRRARVFFARHTRMDADPTAGLVFLLTERDPGAQILTAHRIDDGEVAWSRNLALDRPTLRVDPAKRQVLVRHARSPPRLPYVDRFDYDGAHTGHLPGDGSEVLALAERALDVGRRETARSLLQHVAEDTLVREEAPRFHALTARLHHHDAAPRWD